MYKSYLYHFLAKKWTTFFIQYLTNTKFQIGNAIIHNFPVSNSHFYKEVNPLDMAFASNFPDNFLFLELSGNFKLTQIANRKYPIFEINCNFLAYYNDFQLWNYRFLTVKFDSKPKDFFPKLGKMEKFSLTMHKNFPGS